MPSLGMPRETHENALKRCQELSSNARLFQPQNLWMNSLVYQWTKQISEDYYYWIGINDSNEEGKWVFDQSGEEVTYTNWYSDQPNGGTSENCASVESFSGLWFDVSCNGEDNYICEIPLL